MPTRVPELTANGLVLWRLGRDKRQVCCEVRDVAEGLSLRVHDPGQARTAVSEVHETVEAIVTRADRLRTQFAAAGWHLCDDDVKNLR